jgi:hypothetical protein
MKNTHWFPQGRPGLAVAFAALGLLVACQKSTTATREAGADPGDALVAATAVDAAADVAADQAGSIEGDAGRDATGGSDGADSGDSAGGTGGAGSPTCPPIGNDFCQFSTQDCCPDVITPDLRPKCQDGRWVCQTGTLGPDCSGRLPNCGGPKMNLCKDHGWCVLGQSCQLDCQGRTGPAAGGGFPTLRCSCGTVAGYECQMEREGPDAGAPPPVPACTGEPDTACTGACSLCQRRTDGGRARLCFCGSEQRWVCE